MDEYPQIGTAVTFNDILGPNLYPIKRLGFVVPIPTDIYTGEPVSDTGTSVAVLNDQGAFGIWNGLVEGTEYGQYEPAKGGSPDPVEE